MNELVIETAGVASGGHRIVDRHTTGDTGHADIGLRDSTIPWCHRHACGYSYFWSVAVGTRGAIYFRWHRRQWLACRRSHLSIDGT